MAKFLLAIDQSTAGTKAMLFDERGKVVVRKDAPHQQIITAQGWVEHNPQEIYDNMISSTRRLFESGEWNKEDVIAVAITNQRETAMVWDKETGQPVYNAIVWQCARGEDICQRIRGDKPENQELVRVKTGIPLSPYYSAAKIAWVLEHVPDLPKNFCGSTMDSWLVYKLCGGTPKTDFSNASRTQLLDIHTLSWSEEVAALFGISPAMLPELCDSDALYGYTDFEGLFPEKLPVHGVMGDSHGALFGQGCLEPGMAKATYGTGSSIMMNIGKDLLLSEKGLVTSLAWSLSGKVNYVLEGNINYTGGVTKWLVEDMKLLENAKDAGPIAEKTPHIDGLYLVPAFSGLGAPYWDANARGVIWGMTRDTGREEIIRAGEECIVYQISDILFLMEEETGQKLEVLRVDGGPTGDSFLMQFQSDILNNVVRVPETEELSGAGAAYAAGLALNFYQRETLFPPPVKKEYQPKMEQEKRQQYYNGWKQAVEKVLST